ncbi:hypothetical protein [Staphylococcus epidermidis]|uniref:hypothetical protein n=1 Tax=Staphylococcus epidermidis TaxID=1282 RepID=UPI0011A3760F|nr:hypothetical protein [Staphylococcus epidermidis]
MNEVNEVRIMFTEMKDNCEGKVVEDKGGFCNINGVVCNDEMKCFGWMIEGMSGEEYDKVEIVKRECLI